jgi:hypothetical protein
MLATVNTVKEPWKIEAVCKTKGITQKMSEACGGDAKAALSAFADLCNKEAGVKVATDISTATKSSVKSSIATATGNATLSASKTSYSPVLYTTATFNSNCSCTQTGVLTSIVPVAAPTGIATSVEGAAGPIGAVPTGASPTGAGPALSTGAAGKIGAAYAAIALGGLGAVAALF